MKAVFLSILLVSGCLFSFQSISEYDDGDDEHEGKVLEESIQKFFDRFNQEEIEHELKHPFDLSLPKGKDQDLAPLLQAEPVSIQPPQYRGSESIDFIEGGHHAANGSLMQQALNIKIPQGNVFRFLVGIETVSPLLASAIKQIQTWANQLNAMNMNSVDLATYFLPGKAPKLAKANSFLKEQAMVEEGAAHDFIDARRRLIEKKSVPLQAFAEYTDQVLAGESISKRVCSLLNLSEESQKLFLNLTGTVIVHENGSVVSFPSLHRSVLSLLHSGGTMRFAYEERANKLYRGDYCLEKLAEKQAVFALVQSIQKKLLDNKPLDAEEKAFIHATSLPIGSLISLMTQYKGSSADLVLERYSDLIAFERVLQFASEGLQEILSAAKALTSAQSASFGLDAYIEQVQGVLLDLQEIKKDQDRKVLYEQQAIDLMIRAKHSLCERI